MTARHPNQFSRLSHAERTAFARMPRPERPIMRMPVIVVNRDVSFSTQQPWHVRVTLSAVQWQQSIGGE